VTNQGKTKNKNCYLRWHLKATVQSIDVTVLNNNNNNNNIQISRAP